VRPPSRVDQVVKVRASPLAVATSWATSPGVRRSMQSNTGRDTNPELELRKALQRVGLRFWKNRRPIRGLRCEADVVFPRLRLAVFVDGCFWHGCSEHKSLPVAHGDWWRAKLSRTVTRDRENNDLLARAGWTVVRLWEHESIEDMVSRVTGAINTIRQQSNDQRNRRSAAT
jgi:DNA mismatch endonuclease (patch repair protein)